MLEQPLLERLGGERAPGALVQVAGPARDDEALDEARRVAEVAIDAPEGRAVATARPAQLRQRVEEGRAALGPDAVADLDRDRAGLEVGLVGDEQVLRQRHLRDLGQRAGA